MPSIAFALHGALSITHEPFLNDFDSFLHMVSAWTFFTSPMLAYCLWRKTLHILVRRSGLGDGGAWLLSYLLIGFLLLQLYWFYTGPQHDAMRGFSPTLPEFLAGPIIALALGVIHVQQATQRTFLGVVTLFCSLGWLLFPVAATASLLTDGKGHDNNWFDAVPIAGDCADALLFGITLLFMGLTQSSPWTLVFLLGGAMLLEAWIRKLPFRSSLVSIASLTAILPFFHEWEHFWWD
ncbi:MAG: hypothetical protein ACPG31_07640 [Planctomycetota bacterium]